MGIALITTPMRSVATMLWLPVSLAIYGQKFENLALTPPMGWNSWNHYACDGISERVVMETADAMVGSGMRDAGYEYQDARTYAAWGVDFLKYDWCNTGTQDAVASYTLMRDALFAQGRPVVFSICEWGADPCRIPVAFQPLGHARGSADGR
jgi:hypothetical protein